MGRSSKGGGKMNLENDEISRRMKLGVLQGVARALAEHKKAGRSIVIWKDGKVVKVPPEEIEVPKVEGI